MRQNGAAACRDGIGRDGGKSPDKVPRSRCKNMSIDEIISAIYTAQKSERFSPEMSVKNGNYKKALKSCKKILKIDKGVDRDTAFQVYSAHNHDC